jgi:hypothetical protein
MPVNRSLLVREHVWDGSKLCLDREGSGANVNSFALMEANLLLCTLLFEFDMELVDPQQEWEAKCHMHVNWLKPDLPVRFVRHIG